MINENIQTLLNSEDYLSQIQGTIKYAQGGSYVGQLKAGKNHGKEISIKDNLSMDYSMVMEYIRVQTIINMKVNFRKENNLVKVNQNFQMERNMLVILKMENSMTKIHTLRSSWRNISRSIYKWKKRVDMGYLRRKMGTIMKVLGQMINLMVKWSRIMNIQMERFILENLDQTKDLEKEFQNLSKLMKLIQLVHSINKTYNKIY